MPLLVFGLGPRDLRPFRSIAVTPPLVIPKTIPLESRTVDACRRATAINLESYKAIPRHLDQTLDSDEL